MSGKLDIKIATAGRKRKNIKPKREYEVPRKMTKSRNNHGSLHVRTYARRDSDVK